MFLNADPNSNGIILSVQDSDKDLNYMLWDGSVWDFLTNLRQTQEKLRTNHFSFYGNLKEGNSFTIIARAI
jgi:hypothetical protein